jgi:hypothetical protein
VGAAKADLLGTFVVLHEPVAFARLHVGF